MREFRTITEYDVLLFAVIGLTHKIADLQVSQEQNPADAQIYDEIIEDCDRKLDELLIRMDEVAKEEKRA